MELPKEFQMGAMIHGHRSINVFTQRGVALDNFEKFGI